MSPRSKRRRTGDRCHGTACGQPDCGDCHRDEDASADAVTPQEQQPLRSASASASVSAPVSAPPSPPPQVQSPGLAAMIAALEEKALRDLLLQSAASSQDIQRSIKDAYHRQVARPQPPPLLPQPLLSTHIHNMQATAAAAAAASASRTRHSITSTTSTSNTPASASTPTPLSQMRPVTNFDHYSKSAWHALNDPEVFAMSEYRQHAKAIDIYSDVICDGVNAIDEMTKDPNAPLGTKQNAIETLRKIAKTVILGEDYVGRHVRRHLQHESHIVDLMIRIAESMTPEERLRTGRRADAKGDLISKLDWVREKAVDYAFKDREKYSRILELLKSGFASTGGGQGSSTAPIDLTS